MRRRNAKSAKERAPRATSRLVWAAAPLLLAPCWWQSHVQAGDLGSHIYNVWLVQLIGNGQAPGLTVARQFTNVLFDLILSALLPLGAGATEHLATTLAVCVFLTGAFAFVAQAAGGRPWHVLPVLGALAYGWVFHIGFFNFYLALGLCFWATALCWNATALRVAVAAALLALAVLAHALPVGWACGVIAFRWLAPKVGERRLAVAAAAGIVALRIMVARVAETRWYAFQLWRTTGLDQLWVFDDKYAIAVTGLAAVWAVWWMAQRRSGAAQRSALLYVCGLTALGIFLLPTVIEIPGYKHQIAYVSDRMSLPMAVCMCAWLAPATSGKWLWRASVALSILCFGLLLRDHVALNQIEDEMARAVAQISPGQRVVGAVDAPGLRVDPLAHMLDRLCVGRCFSYGNYEPSTAQFRVRVAGENPIVVSTIEDSYRIQAGIYIVKPRDLPLCLIAPDPEGGFAASFLPAGSRPGVAHWNPLQ